MNYRIVVKTQVNGCELYYPQKKRYGFWWYCRERDYEYGGIKRFYRLDLAEDHIKREIDFDVTERGKRVVKTDILYPPFNETDPLTAGAEDRSSTE